MISWIATNYVEVIGALLGLIFLYLEIKENTWLWPVGLLSSVFYVAIFFEAKFYADMGLQVYYVAISIYGWYKWWRGVEGQHNHLPVVRLGATLALQLLVVTLLLFVAIAMVLKHFTDSPIPYWDSFTTSLSIVATWMLAKKILEQWYLWMVANFVSMCLFVWKGLYPSVVLFFFYFAMSFVGYYAWRKTYRSQANVAKA